MGIREGIEWRSPHHLSWSHALTLLGGVKDSHTLHKNFGRLCPPRLSLCLADTSRWPMGARLLEDWTRRLKMHKKAPTLERRLRPTRAGPSSGKTVTSGKPWVCQDVMRLAGFWGDGQKPQRVMQQTHALPDNSIPDRPGDHRDSCVLVRQH